jgi:non-specific protein-tyrosine kinase
MELDLRHLLEYARRWWWLLLLLPMVAGGGAYAVSSRQQPLYSATATLLINPAPAATGSDLNAINVGQRLAVTYQQLVVTEPVLRPVIDRLGLPYGVDTLKGKVSASAARDTQLLRISVSDTDPATAALIANTVADEFAGFVSAQARASATPSRATLQGLIDTTQAQLTELRTQIQEAESGDSSVGSGVDIESLRARAAQLEQSLADLLVQAQEMDLNAAAAQSQVTVAVPAGVPTTPYAPRVRFYTLLAALLGLMVAGGAVGLIEYLDNTAKSGLDFARLFGVPLLTTIPRIPKLAPGQGQLYVQTQPRSPTAESVRLLRANLEFAAAASEIVTLAVTSAAPGDGKSTVTANLAIAMAQAGMSALLIDADLRRPTQHRIWNLTNDQGLTTLLTRPERPWQSAAKMDVAPNLSILLSGPIPPNPADLLSSPRFQTLLEEIGQTVDIVVIDTPPVLAVSDPLAVATDVDGVIVVASAGRTRIEALRQAIGMLTQRSVRVVGVVLNQEAKGRGSGYSYTGYYGPAESADSGAAHPSPETRDSGTPKRQLALPAAPADR